MLMIQVDFYLAMHCTCVQYIAIYILLPEIKTWNLRLDEEYMRIFTRICFVPKMSEKSNNNTPTIFYNNFNCSQLDNVLPPQKCTSLTNPPSTHHSWPSSQNKELRSKLAPEQATHRSRRYISGLLFLCFRLAQDRTKWTNTQNIFFRLLPMEHIYLK